MFFGPCRRPLSGTPLMLFCGRVGKNCGTMRARVTRSKPDAIRINVGSLNAVPMKLMPSGTPKTFPIGTLTIG